MPVKVRIPTPLRSHTGQKGEVMADGQPSKRDSSISIGSSPAFGRRSTKRMVRSSGLSTSILMTRISGTSGARPPRSHPATWCRSSRRSPAGVAHNRGMGPPGHGVLIGPPSPPRMFRKVGLGGAKMSSGSSG